MPESNRPLAVVTGASSGIGRELAILCAQQGYDLVVAADEPEIQSAAEHFRSFGVEAEPVQVDLATGDGVNALLDRCDGRDVELLLANAGHGLGGAFLDQDFDAVRHVVSTNVTGTLYLVQQIGRRMRERGCGRIMFTGSIAGYMPGAFQAVYNGSKAFVDSFSYALRNELKDSGVTVTCLMPGATDTNFFERAEMLDTRIGTGSKDDPADVAKAGFEAMMKGEGGIIVGLKNKLQVAAATHMSKEGAAEMHRKQAEPGTAKDESAEGGEAGASRARDALRDDVDGDEREHDHRAEAAAAEPADDVPSTDSELADDTETIAASQETMAPRYAEDAEQRPHR